MSTTPELTPMNPEQIQALRMLFLQWCLPADEIPSEFFQFAQDSVWTHPLMSGFLLKTYYVSQVVLHSQYFYLHPEPQSELTIASAFARQSIDPSVGLRYGVNRPDRMPVSWQKYRTCPDCGTNPGTKPLYQDRDCRRCRGMGLRRPEDATQDI